MFTGDEVETSLILQENSGFSATPVITEGTEIRSESKETVYK